MSALSDTQLVESLSRDFNNPDIDRVITNQLMTRPYVLDYTRYVTHGLTGKRFELTSVQQRAWNDFQIPPSDNVPLATIKEIARRHNVPMLANSDWIESLKFYPLDSINNLYRYYKLTTFLQRFGAGLREHSHLTVKGLLPLNGAYESFATFSGRMSSHGTMGQGFNMMALPGLMTPFIKSPFWSNHERLVSYDIPNAEILSLWFISKDQQLHTDITNPNETVYTKIARHLFDSERPTSDEIKIGKKLLIAKTYGQHANSVKNDLVDSKQLLSLEQLSHFYAWFNKEYQTAWHFMANVAKDTNVWMLGKQTQHPSTSLSEYQRQNAVNASIMAYLLKEWAVSIANHEHESGIRLINVVHDNVVVSVPETISNSSVAGYLLNLLNNAMQDTDIPLPISALTYKEFGEQTHG